MIHSKRVKVRGNIVGDPIPTMFGFRRLVKLRIADSNSAGKPAVEVAVIADPNDIKPGIVSVEGFMDPFGRLVAREIQPAYLPE